MWRAVVVHRDCYVFEIDMVSSGRGLCHSEKSVYEGVNGAMQTIVRVPRDKLHLPPQVSRASASELPVIDLQG